MKRTITFLFAAVLIVGAVPMFAQSASTNLGVTATVNANCTIATAPVAFGAYDSLGVTDLAGTGTVSVTCTKGSGVRIDLDLGSHFTGTTRRMAGGGDFLTYELYKEVAHTNIWGSGAVNGNLLGARGALDPKTRTYTVYGNIAGGQDVAAAAAYTDTVKATIIF